MGMYPGGNIIKIQPTVDTAAYGNTDVIFDKQELKNIVPSRGGCSLLHHVSIATDAGDSTDDFAVMFFDNDTGIGAAQQAATSGITVAEFQAAGFIGAITWDGGNNAFSCGATYIYHPGQQNNPNGVPNLMPMCLKAAEGKTSIWVSLISIGGTLDLTSADGLDMTFGVQYLG